MDLSYVLIRDKIMYEGKKKLILKHLGFLVENYNMKFVFLSFPKFMGFYGPSDCYCFYNDNGCFTIHNLVQRGEWGLFNSPKFSNYQHELLFKEISQRPYFNRSYYTASGWLKELAKVISNEIKLKNSFFSIKVN